LNAHVAFDGLTSLRRIDPDDAALGSALCALLGKNDVQVSIARQVTGAAWFAAGDGAKFHIARIDDHAVPLSPERISDAVSALDHADPMLVAIEQALGIPMDADVLTADAPDNAIFIALTCGADEIHLAIPRDHPRRDEWLHRAAFSPLNNAQMPCIVQIEAVGPRLHVAEASDLADGDLLLIPNKAPATLSAAHIAPVPGMIDLTTGIFSAGQNGASMPDNAPAPDFMVPLTIRLPDRMTSAASLSSLVPGTTLPLGPLTEGMPVELRVADRLLARGELVQLGDRFAVLVESREDIADPVSEDTE
jgi:flagellar motor switch/type III secretory pathway protein FliN